MISFACPQCKTTHRAADEAAGSVIACTACGRRMRVPQPTPPMAIPVNPMPPAANPGASGVRTAPPPPMAGKHDHEESEPPLALPAGTGWGSVLWRALAIVAFVVICLIFALIGAALNPDDPVLGALRMARTVGVPVAFLLIFAVEMVLLICKWQSPRRDQGSRPADKPRRRPDEEEDDDPRPQSRRDDRLRPRATSGDRRQPARADSESSNWVVWLVLGVVGGAIVLVGLIAILAVGITRMNSRTDLETEVPAVRDGQPGERDKPLAENERPDPPKKAPFAVDPKLLGGAGKVYLSDMQEFAWKRGWPGWTHFGKNGQLGDPDPRKVIKVNGASYPKGLAMAPEEHGYTRVCYALGKKAQSLSGAVAFSETGGIGLGPVRFVILGDGEVLWRSKVVRELRVIEKFTVDVAKVQTLELRVYAQEGNNWSSHAAWLDPSVTTKQPEP